jgi:hypothetical protein
MYSLAVLAAIIFSVLIFSGPIAIGLTFIRINNPTLQIVRRVFVCVFSAAGVGLASILLFQGIAIGAKLVALFAMAASGYALRREFTRK